MRESLYCLMHELDRARNMAVGSLAAVRAERTVQRGGAIGATMKRLLVTDTGVWRILIEHEENLLVIRRLIAPVESSKG
jgi:hypothetical protein